VAHEVLDRVSADPRDGVHGRLLALQRVQQLAQEQRVAARHPVAGTAQLVRRAGPQPLAHQPGHRGLAQRPGAQDRHRRVGGKLGQQPLVLARLRVAGGQDEQDGQLLDPPGQVAEERQRARVGPVQVVDHGDERPLVGHLDQEPEQPVQQLEARLRAVRERDRRLRGQRGLRARRRLGEPVRPLGRRGASDEALEQLAHDAVGEALLELGAAGAQHGHAGVGGERAGHRAERRLAHAGRTDHGHDVPATAGQRAQRADQRLVLRPPLQQPLQLERPREPPRRVCSRHRGPDPTPGVGSGTRSGTLPRRRVGVRPENRRALTPTRSCSSWTTDGRARRCWRSCWR
jgi:hypothetical protein